MKRADSIVGGTVATVHRRAPAFAAKPRPVQKPPFVLAEAWRNPQMQIQPGNACNRLRLFNREIQINHVGGSRQVVSNHAPVRRVLQGQRSRYGVLSG